ncbi:DUF6584 family protein [Streptomyces sp. NPDC060028]|uniref:DUF6584 family protein n=1 Tax=Streptomyces sp. NPDC060028 TaxID=3347041 RepID=UPI0036AE43E4
MTLVDTLARIDSDLAAGRVPLARQRLRGLVSSFPWDLALRRRLAEVYRLYGEAAEAGRWMYLEADRDPVESAAFEARYRLPLRRMRALAWHAPESLAGTAFAAEQLAALRAAGSHHVGRPVEWTAIPADDDGDEGVGPLREGSPFPDRLIGAGYVLLALVFIAVWSVGFVTSAHWLWR